MRHMLSSHFGRGAGGLSEPLLGGSDEAADEEEEEERRLGSGGSAGDELRPLTGDAS